MDNEIKAIALYLPQYHPVKENSEWYGEGFTEWTNVAKAKPLFPGHYEPHIPADLGFYDLRLKEVRHAQANMAKEYGISAFCYWTYWFGGDRTILDMPMKEILKDKELDFPFCLAWANHDWEKKLWDKKSKNTLLLKQEYNGEKDYEHFFYMLLPYFKDKRYLKINNKLFFIIYDSIGNENIKVFINKWRDLAVKEGIPGFYFVGKDSDCRIKEKILSYGFNAIYDDKPFNIHHRQNILIKCVQMAGRKIFKIPTIFKYKNAVKYMVTENDYAEDVIPCIAPNWDHSPRSGRNSILLHDCKPEYFKIAVKKAIDAVKNRKGDKVIIIKSWNEWGEGNHMEPDLKYGRGYLEAFKSATDEYYESLEH